MPIDTAAAPIRTNPIQVAPEWIDYNGHMNVAYYVLAFDKSLDEVFDALDLGEAATHTRNMGPMALQSQICYLGELLEGEAFACDFQMLDTDHKRTHFIMTMHGLDAGRPAATYESLSINVDLTTRKSIPYPPDVAARLSDLMEKHRHLPRPPQAGAMLGIRR